MLTPERLLSGISLIFSFTGAITIILSIVGIFMEHSVMKMFQPFMVGLGLITIGLVLLFIVDFSRRLTRIEAKIDASDHEI